jgi:hypothetical protein
MGVRVVGWGKRTEGQDTRKEGKEGMRDKDGK